MFELSKEQLDIQKAAREFAQGEFSDVARELDEKGSFDDRLWKKAADLGFLAVFIPEKYQGLGMGYLEQCLIVEEFARVDLGITHAIESSFFGSQLIDMVGTEDQKKRYLPPICLGEIKMGMATITTAEELARVTPYRTSAATRRPPVVSALRAECNRRYSGVGNGRVQRQDSLHCINHVPAHLITAATSTS